MIHYSPEAHRAFLVKHAAAYEAAGGSDASVYEMQLEMGRVEGHFAKHAGTLWSGLGVRAGKAFQGAANFLGDRLSSPLKSLKAGWNGGKYIANAEKSLVNDGVKATTKAVNDGVQATTKAVNDGVQATTKAVTPKLAVQPAAAQSVPGSLSGLARDAVGVDVGQGLEQFSGGVPAWYGGLNPLQRRNVALVGGGAALGAGGLGLAGAGLVGAAVGSGLSGGAPTVNHY